MQQLENDSLIDKTASQERDGLFRNWSTSRLRLLVLLPMMLAFVGVVLFLSLLLYEHAQERVDEDVARISISAHDLYDEGVAYDVKALKAVMHTLLHDGHLRELFAKGERQPLLQYSAPLFKQLKQSFSITHMYFTGVDKVNLLRVHAPPRHGDLIKRKTTQMAAETGVMAYGVELGPLGTFTLRLVSPWYDPVSQQLIGYVELGMEIDQILGRIRDYFGVETVTAINKSFLDRAQWESGMRTLGRTPHWEFYDGVVTTAIKHSKIMHNAIRSLEQSRWHSTQFSEQFKLRSSYRILSMPLRDVSQREVAHLVLVTDLSEVEHSAFMTMLWGLIIAIFLATLLMVFFYWLVGRIGERIERDRYQLEVMATHDGLTGLYNHRMFHHLCQDEIDRSVRYQRSLALLMVDIDLFKAVNDEYGHQAGDRVLQQLSKALVSYLRTIDRVSRYGGEEIGIILPELDEAQAKLVAERLIKSVSAYPFEIGDGQVINITLSIGVASFAGKEAVDVDPLIAQADRALYRAKESGRNQACLASEL